MSQMRYGIYYSLGATPIEYDPITGIYRYVPQVKCKNAGDDGYVCLMPDHVQYPDWHSDPAYFQGGGEEYDESGFEALLRAFHSFSPERIYDGLMLNPASPANYADLNPLVVIRRMDALDPRYVPYVTVYRGINVIPIDTMARLSPEWQTVDAMTVWGPMIAMIIVTAGAAAGAGAAGAGAAGAEGAVIAGESTLISTETIIAGEGTAELIGSAAADELITATAAEVATTTAPGWTLPAWLTNGLTAIGTSLVKALITDSSKPGVPRATTMTNPYLPAGTVVDSQPFSAQSLEKLALPALAVFALALIIKRRMK